ncbi:hypothetical protein AKG98_861 [Moritella sp. JT01]|uniref:hypothetical protein n=1 Tax=Moritella sp. JT01 TaxID=756698 RepID=UPI000798033C|nr:hypothetical protein [Moritella sp. JT01]KXO10077.1 hypothetical protein AKG98_861 [Moritella sp. JT01]
MEAHKLILEYLIENPNVESINESSEIDIVTFKEMINHKLVSGMNACSDIGDCFLEPRITFRGREWLESKKVELVSKEPQEDVVELKPNFMGIGLNLNALYRLFKRR